MSTVYINKQTKRNFEPMRSYLVKYFAMTGKSIRLVKANLKSELDYFVVAGVTFENRGAFK